jgi:hypothetical protein
VLTEVEQQALIDAHEAFPVPLNPNIDPVTGQLTPLAALGRDLFFGEDSTGLNPSLRHAGCAECHPKFDPGDMFGETERLFTADKLPSLLTGTPGGLPANDPGCQSLAENLIGDGFRDVNTGVDLDIDGFPGIDVDRNGDGIDDRESYEPMYPDTAADFVRDDPNSWPCPVDPFDPFAPPKTLLRAAESFGVPTKLGLFASGPYFHDHVASSLRALLDPSLQSDQATLVDYDKDGDPANDMHPLYAKYGDPSFPVANKIFNEVHDVRGNDLFAPSSSKVQLDLRSADEALLNGIPVAQQIDADLEALLAFLESL